MTGINPWRRFGALSAFRLAWHAKDDRADRGVTNYRLMRVSIRDDLDQAGRRSAILHECLHIERGVVPRGMKAKEEVQVRKLTAELLLPDVVAIGDALIWAQGHVEPAAEELWVHVDVLKDRLRFLEHPQHRDYLLKRLREEAPAP